MRGRSAPKTLLLACLGMVALVTAGSCGNTRPCRQGTVFATLRLGPFASADSLTIDVTVEGSTPRQQTLPLSGAASGGVEITFPSGYPAGTSVTVVATLRRNSSVLAMRAISTVLAPGCTSLEIDFGGADAGLDSTVGSGGRPGGTGGQGTGGGAGTPGSGGGIGSGGSAGGGTGGGTGGGIGGGGAGANATGGGGVVGGGGAGGAVTGGRGGGGAGGGVTGGRGGGGAGGRGGGGAGGACMPTATSENCFNSVDDDCDGHIDCADMADCYETAQCVPLDPSMGIVGASVATSAACPAGAPNSRALNSGLMATGCTGCSCATGTATLTCRADIYGYVAAADSTCTANTGGQLVTTLNSTQACFTPNWPTTNGFVFGVRAGPFQGTPGGTCLPGGAATKGTPVWGSTSKFCAIPTVGGGCMAGSACVPRSVAAAGPCLLMDGARMCPASIPRSSSWFTGFTDTRTCGACTCGAPTGGDCGPMLIGVGNDYSCPPSSVLGYLRNADRLCFTGNGAYSPGLQFSGTPVAPTCAAASAQSGSLSATGPQTLCCL